MKCKYISETESNAGRSSGTNYCSGIESTDPVVIRWIELTTLLDRDAIDGRRQSVAPAAK